MLADTVRTEIAAVMDDAPQGQKTATAERLAQIYGVSKSTIYQAAKRGGTPRKRTETRPEYRQWARIAVALAHQPPQPLPLDLAIRAGIESSVLPAEAAEMPISTAYRLAREMGLQDKAPRTHRLHADYPMQAVLIDWSSSQHLLAEHPEGDDWVLKLHRRPVPASGYKNRPLKPHRQRLGVYSLWDMCTGYTVARYAVERGETALGALEFLCWALGQDKDKRLVLHGMPSDLWSDLGPLVRSDAAADLLERLDIALVTGEPYSKSRMGGVERSHRTRWGRFERSLFLRGAQTIRLSQLNARLTEYSVEENAGRASRTPVADRPASRTAAWTALTNARPQDNPLRKMPDNPIETLAREARRKIDVNGIVRWDGIEYEAKDWHDRWVMARRAADGSGDLTIEDEAAGEKRIARRYIPRPYGAVRSSPASALDRLLADTPQAPGADIWKPVEAAWPSNVLPMRTRSAPAAALENPLAGGDRCRDVGEAMRLFTSIYPWRLSAANRALIVEQIEDSGLPREAVTTLAQELSALAHKEGGGK